MLCIFSIDVEDWFHILDLPSTPALSEWDALPSCVEKNFRKLLDLLSERNVKATCFFLGWIAEKFPHLIREAKRRGHEIASHGYSHRLVHKMTPQEFYEDVRRSKNAIEDISGRPVLGYRAPGFSMTKDTPWFFRLLATAGYQYDSSVLPAPHMHGDAWNGNIAPYVVETAAGSVIEFPVSVQPVLGRPICFFGGGHLRLFPYWLIHSMTAEILRQGRPVVFYVHPREIDPDHPRLPMNLVRRFKSYVNLQSTETKIRRLLADQVICSFEAYLKSSSTQFGHPLRWDARPSLLKDMGESRGA
jgi:polysaccharide deacetylase family protein (PEP-CTERM system associated)